ncbi:immunoglobulin lambda-1 light chain-like [Solea senegalensis]|nr:immunoglobulin lambda-1 light chain-like [Solea senegalensis]
MLGTLCTLITALTYVDAAIVLTQTPAVHTVSAGQEVVLSCNIQRYDSNYVSWYKQVPGGVPQYVLRFYHSDSSLEFGTGFSSDRFHSKSSSNIDYQFIIKRAEAGDSAQYFCSTGDDSAVEASDSLTPHTDNMLGTLCTLITALTYVDAAIVLTQTPAVHTVSAGQEVVLSCNIQRYDDNIVYWYKQVPGGVPQYVLWFDYSDSSLDFGTGFSSDRFHSKSSSNIDYQFIIKRAEAGDSAQYFCSTWDDSASEDVSHHVYKLNHCGIRTRHQADCGGLQSPSSCPDCLPSVQR